MNVIEDKPFKIKPYPIPFFRYSVVLHEINSMLEWGVMKRSNSNHNNPMLSIQKPDNTIRLYLDAHKLNSIIVPTRNYSLLIGDILANLNLKSKLFLLYEDFYRIRNVKNINAYVLEHPKDRPIPGTFNIIHMKKYIPHYKSQAPFF